MYTFWALEKVLIFKLFRSALITVYTSSPGEKSEGPDRGPRAEDDGSWLYVGGPHRLVCMFLSSMHGIT